MLKSHTAKITAITGTAHRLLYILLPSTNKGIEEKELNISASEN